MERKTNKKIKIIAGPCSVNKNNIEELFEIANIRIKDKGKRAVWGVRFVGLKSRTYMSNKTVEMGMDFEEYLDKFKRRTCVSAGAFDSGWETPKASVSPGRPATKAPSVSRTDARSSARCDVFGGPSSRRIALASCL